MEIEKASQGAPWSERAFLNELENPHSVFRVALLGREVVAYGGIWLLVDEAHVTTITVSEKHRRQRIGRHLMDELMREANAKGMVCATLEVRAGNEPALLLYEQMGFKRVAVRKGYYPDNREDAVVMWLYDLSPWGST